jgi:hypothetical protein
MPGSTRPLTPILAATLLLASVAAQASTVDWSFTGVDVTPSGGLSQHYPTLGTGGQPAANEAFTGTLVFDTSTLVASANTGNLPTGTGWSYYAPTAATFSITEGGNTVTDGVLTFALNASTQMLAFNNTGGNTVYLNLSGFSGLTDPGSLAGVSLAGVTGTIGSDDFGTPVNITSIAAVPLPAALPLLLAGLAGLGVTGRRRRAV